MPVSQLVASILKSEAKAARAIFAQNNFTQQQLEEFIQEAKNGNRNAQYIVGYMYATGEGVEVSKEKAFEFYLLAANQGHMVAQNSVGGYFYEGREVQQDYTKAVEYYLKSANQGNGTAQYNLGLCYANGQGVAQDFQKAIEYYQMAIAKGYTGAKNNIGWVYHQKQDYDKAMEYYLQAVEEGNAEALNNIGVHYEEGYGVAVDYNKALSFYHRAAEKGHEGAKKRIELLTEKMDEQISPSLSSTPTPTPNTPTSSSIPSPTPTSNTPTSPPIPSSTPLSTPSPASISQTKPLPSKTEDWTVDDVITWISSIGLSQSYQELIRDSHVTGKVLLTMKTKEDWRELGVTKFGDLRLLVGTPITGGKVESTTRINSRLAHTEGMDDVVYKPIINLMKGGFKPPHSCEKHMLTDLPNVLLAVRNLSEIVKECVLVAESRLQHRPSHVPTLSADEALAIAAYSYDLGVVDVEVNLYHSLNTILRKRDPKKMERLKPFLFYLMIGLTKLPPLQTTVYRGIPFSSMQMIQDNYRLGLSVHWSGFTSASTDIKSAKDFAQESGIIFRIKVMTGRSIKHYSSIPSEDEVLLSPNIKLLVASGVQLESDGFYYLDLIEQLTGPAFVF